MKLFLGKKRKLVDTRTLQFSKYAKTGLPTPPSKLDISQSILQWGVMKNDTIGDCAIASPGHMIMDWTKETKNEFIPTDEQIIEAYSGISGYDPITGNNDNGCYILDVLNYWHKTGIAGHTILAFAEIKLSVKKDIKDALYLFNGIDIGLQLPLSAQNQIGQIWKTGRGASYQPGSWGGHSVCIVGYDSKYLYCITWGAIQKMTWAFWNKYCDEAYAIISNDYIADGKTIEGFDMIALQKDLELI